MNNSTSYNNAKRVKIGLKTYLFITILVLFSLRCVADINAQISCDFESQDICLVLTELANQAGVNIIVDDTLQKKVTLKLDGVQFSEIIQMLKDSFSFEVTMKDNLLVVTPKNQYNSANYGGQANEATTSEIIQLGIHAPEVVIPIINAISSELEIISFPEQTLVVISGPYSKVNMVKSSLTQWLYKPSTDTNISAEIYKLNYIDAQDISYLSGIITGVRISTINTLNAVIVSGDANTVSNTLEIIRSLDKAPKVVQISVEMLEVKQGDLKDIGISLKGNNGYNSLSLKWDEQSVQQKPWGSGGEEENDKNILDLIKLRPWVRASMSLLTEVNLLVEEGKAKILARPSLTTLENKTAKIHTGERYTLVLYQNNYQQLQYIDVGVQLEITPKVDEDGNITAVLNPVVSAITGITKEGYPRISTRQVKTTVRVKDGETLVIGGLVEETELKTTHGIPILSKLPVLRWVFSKNKNSEDKTELIIVVTFNTVEDK